MLQTTTVVKETHLYFVLWHSEFLCNVLHHLWLGVWILVEEFQQRLYLFICIVDSRLFLVYLLGAGDRLLMFGLRGSALTSGRYVGTSGRGDGRWIQRWHRRIALIWSDLTHVASVKRKCVRFEITYTYIKRYCLVLSRTHLLQFIALKVCTLHIVWASVSLILG